MINLTSPSQVKALLEELDIHPRKALGQNFLIDRNILNIIRSLAELRREDVVLEVGPGLGILTDELVGLTHRVYAIEMDPTLAAYLRDHYAGTPGFNLVESDALDVDLAELLAQGVTRFVSNLPYSSGTRILLEIIEAPHRPDLMVVMVQKDVAQRLAASPHTKEYGLVSIMAQLFYDVTVEKDVSPHCFLPAPEIWSAIVRFRKKGKPIADARTGACVHRLAKWCFTHRRKQLSTLFNHPPSGLQLDPAHTGAFFAAAEIDPKDRPENVSVEQWARLARAVLEV